MARITSAGLTLLAQLQAAGQSLTIDKFIYADIAGLDTTVEPPANTVLPAAADIKHQSTITKAGYVGPDTVVYSNMLSSAVGDFYFNWIGLFDTAHNTLVAVSFVPRQQKKATASFQMGNTLTKNFAVQYQNLTDLTGVTINASTWQIDLFARLKGIDERERLSNYDIYGTKYFFANGFLLVKNGTAYELTAGIGYVDGIRIALAAVQNIGATGALPKMIYLDTCLNGDYSGVEALWTVQISAAALSHYQDAAKQQHYLEKIATINTDGSVTDNRGDGTGGTIRNSGDLMAAHLAAADPHTQYAKKVDIYGRNLLLNGDFQVAQRGTNFINPVSGSETFDAWLVYRTTNHPAVSVYRNSGVPTTDANYNKLAILSTGAGGVAGTDQICIEQRLLSPIQLRGKTVTVTIRYKCAGTTPGKIVLYDHEGSFTGVVPLINDGTWRTASVTVQIPELNEHIAYIAATSSLFTNGSWLIIDYIKAEFGAIATPYQPNPYEMELAACCQLYDARLTGRTFFSYNATENQALPLLGALINIATYKRLYDWAVSQGRTCTAAQKAANLNGYKGYFVLHDNGTQMYLPDWSDMFVRSTNSAGTRVCGSYQADELKSHGHELAITAGGGGTLGARSDSGPLIADPVGTHVKPFGGAETRPANIAQIPYINY